MKSKKIKLEFPAKSINEAFARVFASAFAARLDPTMEELADIRTAISEAVTNAVVHAYPSTEGIIRMTAYADGNTLEYTVKDYGVGIPDVKKAMEPLFTTGGEERSGLGFTIMQSFMTSVRVTSRPGKGTTVKLVKKIGARTGK